MRKPLRGYFWLGPVNYMFHIQGKVQTKVNHYMLLLGVGKNTHQNQNTNKPTKYRKKSQPKTKNSSLLKYEKWVLRTKLSLAKKNKYTFLNLSLTFHSQIKQIKSAVTS